MSDFLETRYEKDPSVVYRQIAGEAILVPIRQRTADLDGIYTLNDTGATIWGLLDGKRSLREIATLLAAEYDVSSDVAEADLVELIQQLESLACVTRIE
jgi:hypothetical protein